MCQHCDNFNQKLGEFPYKIESEPQRLLESYVFQPKTTEQLVTQKELRKELEKYLGGYLKDLKKVYDKAIDTLADLVIKELSKLDSTVSETTVQNAIIKVTQDNWQEIFAEDQEEVTNKYITKGYRAFRTDETIFEGSDKDAPKPKFSKQDRQTIEYFKKSDNHYLEKFIRDDDVKKAVQKYTQDKYIQGEIPFSDNSGAKKSFKKGFTNTLEQKDWKIDQIGSTTMNRMRNDATVEYMNQAGVTTYMVQGVPDRAQCQYCKSMQGRKFSVVNQIQNIADRNELKPEELKEKSPFLTTLKIEEVREMTDKELARKGFTSPPFHPRCRDVIVIV